MDPRDIINIATPETWIVFRTPIYKQYSKELHINPFFYWNGMNKSIFKSPGSSEGGALLGLQETSI